MARKMITITLTEAEVRSGMDRQNFAENLILQLPATHDGRNTWLINYGEREEAQELRTRSCIHFDPITRAAK